MQPRVDGSKRKRLRLKQRVSIALTLGALSMAHQMNTFSTAITNDQQIRQPDNDCRRLLGELFGWHKEITRKVWSSEISSISG